MFEKFSNRFPTVGKNVWKLFPNCLENVSKLIANCLETAGKHCFQTILTCICFPSRMGNTWEKLFKKFNDKIRKRYIREKCSSLRWMVSLASPLRCDQCLGDCVTRCLVLLAAIGVPLALGGVWEGTGSVGCLGAPVPLLGCPLLGQNLLHIPIHLYWV